MNRAQQSLMTGIVMAVTAWGAAWGQVISPQFNLITPGARSLGMGGAFLALADDATAAYTNPAGLTNLIAGGPQVAVELRSWGYSTPYFAEGRLDGNSNLFGLDLGEDINLGSAETEVSDLSFASFAYVLPRGYTFALYKNQLANYSTAFESEGLFFDASSQAANGGPFINPGNPTWRTAPISYSADVRIDSVGGAIAYEIRRPAKPGSERSLSIGVGIARYQLRASTGILQFSFKPLLDPSGVDGVFGRSQFLPGMISGGREEVGDDSAVALSYGFLWKLQNRGHWALGGVYREGPSFTTRRSDLAGADFAGTLTIPDIYGVGISYSPARSEGRTKIAFDYQSIRYSQRLGDLFAGAPDPAFELPDGEELHLGVERVVWTSGKFVATARLGGWRESAHELKYTGSEARDRALYPGGEDQSHWAMGLGLVVGEEYQIDAAIDRSDRVNTLSVSIVRFF